MLLIVSIVLTIIFFICFSICFDKDYEIRGIACLFGGVVSGIIATICVVFFIGSHIQYFKASDKLKLEQQRAAIIYCLESSPESVVGLASDISEYNSTIMTGRLRHNSIWFSNITYDFYDELELIEVG
jgi:hypothetical protein